jgi:hypothetical protein
MLEDIKSEEFTVLKGTSLEIEANGQRHTVQVVEVRPYKPHSERPQPPFSVVLLAGRALLLPQGIYRLHHPARGALDLLMMPLGPDARGMRYEIVFN